MWPRWSFISVLHYQPHAVCTVYSFASNENPGWGYLAFKRPWSEIHSPGVKSHRWWLGAAFHTPEAKASNTLLSECSVGSANEHNRCWKQALISFFHWVASKSVVDMKDLGGPPSPSVDEALGWFGLCPLSWPGGWRAAVNTAGWPQCEAPTQSWGQRAGTPWSSSEWASMRFLLSWVLINILPESCFPRNQGLWDRRHALFPHLPTLATTHIHPKPWHWVEPLPSLGLVYRNEPVEGLHEPQCHLDLTWLPERGLSAQTGKDWWDLENEWIL